MLLNTLLIPIGATAGTTNNAVIDVMRKLIGKQAITSDPFFFSKLSDFVSSNLMIHQNYYIKMIINLCFVTNGVERKGYHGEKVFH